MLARSNGEADHFELSEEANELKGNQAVSLSLEIVSYKDGPPADGAVCVFNQEGGTIGRSEDNRCVLPDTEGVVSRVHARILYRDGKYFLVDQSTNGTFVNDPSNRLADGVENEIHAGDRFLIGDYVILARLEESVVTEEAFEPFSPETRVDSLAGFDMAGVVDRAARPESESENLQELEESWADNARRPDWFPANEASETDAQAESRANGRSAAEEPGPTPVLQHHMPPPGGVSEPTSDESPPPLQTAVPTGYIPFVSEFEDLVDRQLVPDEVSTDKPVVDEAPSDAQQEPCAEGSAERGPTPVDGLAKAPPPEAKHPGSPLPAEGPHGYEFDHQPPQADKRAVGLSAATDAELLRAFVAGLGVPNLRVADDQLPALMNEFGRLTREVIQGLIETLRLRAEFKREFYVPATSIGPIENNIFKYSVNVDDALTRMFSDSADAYLSPVDSARQSFQDIAAHHLAMVAGMQAAVATLLEKFSPQLLREHLGKGSVLDGLFSQSRKARMWEQFESEYKKIAEQAQEDFHRVFGQSFSHAYTQQVMRLQAVGSSSGDKDDR